MPAELLNLNSQNPDPRLIAYLADQIRAGKVLGVPTDTFYSLAADPLNLRAVERIYELKGRTRTKALSLLIESVDQAEELARPLPAMFYSLAERFWPGPLTMIVKASSRLPLKVTANTGNVALRVPDAAIPLALVNRVGSPITGTSANASGASECTTVEGLREQFGERLTIMVNGGPSPRGEHTTIVDLSGDWAPWRILREGAISAGDIAEAIADS